MESPSAGTRPGRRTGRTEAESAPATAMTGPLRYLVRMLVFLAVVAAVAGALGTGLYRAFLDNAALNGLILGVLLLGIVYMMRQVAALRPEVTWVEQQRALRASMANPPRPSLLAQVARALDEQGERPVLSTIAMRSLLDGIAARLDESRELSRYLIGLLIFLGLLGTFWGLLQTVAAVGDVIGQLSVAGSEDVASMFSELQSGLEAPLQGMGTAFSSSLFGLAGSLVLGFLELQASQAQNRFYNEVEEWLSTLTRHAAAPGAPAGETGGDEGAESTGGEASTAYLHALIAQTAENLDNLQRAIEASEADRREANQNVVKLTETLSTLTDQMRTEQSLMHKLAENQQELKPLIGRLAEVAGSGELGIDEATKAHIRNLETYMGRLMDEVAAGRSQTVSEIRSEIKVLARTLGAVAGPGEAGRGKQG